MSIGTCTVRYGTDKKDIVICPHRLLERRQIFADCLHLLINKHLVLVVQDHLLDYMKREFAL